MADKSSRLDGAMSGAVRILLLEDSEIDAELIESHLGSGPLRFEIERAENREGFSEALAAADMLSYRVMLLEREGDRFRPTSDFPPLSLACVTSHDLPTFAGWWSGADISERASLGAIGDEAAAASDRERDKAALTERLDPADAGDLGSVTGDVHATLAAGNSALVMIQAEELVLEDRAVNMPGTDRERPNWRRRLRVPVPELFHNMGAAILGRIRESRG